MKAIIIKSEPNAATRIAGRVFRAIAMRDRNSYNVPGDGTYSAQGRRTMSYFGGTVIERGIKLLGVWLIIQTGF